MPEQVRHDNWDGALRGAPAREGGEQRSANQGETSPFSFFKGGAGFPVPRTISTKQQSCKWLLASPA